MGVPHEARRCEVDDAPPRQSGVEVVEDDPPLVARVHRGKRLLEGVRPRLIRKNLS